MDDVGSRGEDDEILLDPFEGEAVDSLLEHALLHGRRSGAIQRVGDPDSEGGCDASIVVDSVSFSSKWLSATTLLALLGRRKPLVFTYALEGAGGLENDNPLQSKVATVGPLLQRRARRCGERVVPDVRTEEGVGSGGIERIAGIRGAIGCVLRNFPLRFGAWGDGELKLQESATIRWRNRPEGSESTAKRWTVASLSTSNVAVWPTRSAAAAVTSA